MKTLALCALSFLLLSGCREERERGASYTSYGEIGALLERCAPCHSGGDAAAGYRTTSYYDVLGCIDAAAATRPSDSHAPLLAALKRPDHVALLTDSERARIEQWVERGARGERGAAHGPGILDPRSDEWHGKLAAERAFEPLRAREADGVCGRCHDGAPVRPSAVRFAAPTAPACTSCHDQPGGVLACSTCHGQGSRAYPPRDGCYFNDAGAAGAHAAHLTPSPFRAEPLACASCHPTPSASVFDGLHANGSVDVRFGAAQGAYEPTQGVCTAPCHARGGALPTPSWREQPTLDCNSCHLSPPRDHYSGPCATCHSEMGPTATSLRPGSLHINGVVDLGRGGTGCGACHGEGDDPWPRDTVHRRHRDSQVTLPLRCDECHTVPTELRAPGHLDGRVDVRFAGRAVAQDAGSWFDGDRKTCNAVACHAGALRRVAEPPRWRARETEGVCATCHQAPPPSPHVQQPSCGGALCHGSEVRGAAPALGITESGRSQHLDGVLQAGGR